MFVCVCDKKKLSERSEPLGPRRSILRAFRRGQSLGDASRPRRHTRGGVGAQRGAPPRDERQGVGGAIT